MALPSYLTQYAPGVYAADAYGNLVLQRAVTQNNFRGAPLVGVFQGEGSFATGAYDANLAALVAFTAQFGAGTVVIDDNLNNEGKTYITESFKAYSALFTSDRETLPVITDGHVSVPAVISGPWVGLGNGASSLNASLSTAWITSANYVRTTQYSPWLNGLDAIGYYFPISAEVTSLTPPVYKFRSDYPSTDAAANRQDFFNKLTLAFQGKATTATADVQTLQTLSLTKPGVERLVNPTLVPFLQLTTP